MKALCILTVLGFVVASCNSNDRDSDAYGNFEAKETIVSARSNGEIISLSLHEGEVLSAGQKVGMIDTTALYLQINQLRAKKESVKRKIQSIEDNADVLEAEKKTVARDCKRIRELHKTGAATQKQLDHIEGKLDVIIKKIRSVQTEKLAVLSELDAFSSQIDQVEYKKDQCVIENPIQGTVLEKYAMYEEVISYGRPVYKIANLNSLDLRAYISGGQLDNFSIGDTVEVLIDKNQDKMHSYAGIVEWVSAKAEFTPKIIQTREERVNLVYAVKIRVENDGKIKIGMPGEVIF
jgi:HlyD family secretion protein